MNKNLLAFFLAALTLSLPLMTLSAISTPIAKPLVRINIQSNADVSNIVTAITALHRSDVVLQTEKQGFVGIGAILVAAGLTAMGLMLVSAMVGFLYKFYCERLGVMPTI